MQSEGARQPVGWGIVWLTVPAWLMLGVEVVGEWRFEKNQYSGQYALNLGAWYNSLAVIAFALLAMAPFLIAFGWSTFLKGEFSNRTRMPRPLVFFFALSFIVSLLSCLWTCSGHPTWTSGYTHDERHTYPEDQ